MLPSTRTQPASTSASWRRTSGLSVRVADDGRGRRGCSSGFRPARTRGPRPGARRHAERRQPAGRRHATAGRAADPSPSVRDLRRSLRVVAACARQPAGAGRPGAGAVRRARRGDRRDRAQRSGVRAGRRLGRDARRRARRRPAADRLPRLPPGGTGWARRVLRRCSIVAALAWPLGEWAVPGAGAAFTAGLLLYAAWPPLLAAAALARTRRAAARPDGRPRPRVRVRDEHRRAGRRVGSGLRPAGPGLPAVSAKPPARRGDASAWHDLGQAGLALSASGSRRFAALAAARLARASPARRRVAAPVLVPAVAALVLFGDRRAARARSRLLVQRPHRPRAVGRRDRRAGAGGGRRRVGAGPHAARARRRSPGSWSTSAHRRRPAACASGSRRRSTTPRWSSSTAATTARAGSTPTGAR